MRSMVIGEVCFLSGDLEQTGMVEEVKAEVLLEGGSFLT